jgi:hypothetical protein
MHDANGEVLLIIHFRNVCLFSSWPLKNNKLSSFIIYLVEAVNDYQHICTAKHCSNFSLTFSFSFTLMNEKTQTLNIYIIIQGSNLASTFNHYKFVTGFIMQTEGYNYGTRYKRWQDKK